MKKNTELDIDYKRLEETSGLDFSNVIKIDEDTLNEFKASVGEHTEEITDCLLQILPLMLAYKAGLNKISAIMSDSFGIVLEQDDSVESSLKEIIKFELVYLFIKKLNLPKGKKNRIFNTYVEQTMPYITKHVDKAATHNVVGQQIKHLQAVLASRGGKKRKEDKNGNNDS